MAAGSQGEFPVAFNGGLWRWNRDVLNWGAPHHWNQQQEYWGLCAQNDCQLMLPYLDTYFRMIPFAEKLAKEYGSGDDALLITEAHNFNDCIRAARILNVDKDKVKKWQYVLDHLWERTYQQFGECGEVTSPAEEYYTERRYSPWIWGNGGAVAFPAGLTGIDDKDTRLGKVSGWNDFGKK